MSESAAIIPVCRCGTTSGRAFSCCGLCGALFAAAAVEQIKPVRAASCCCSSQSTRRLRTEGPASSIPARHHQKPVSVNLHSVGRVALDIQQVNGPLTLTLKGSAMRRVKPPSYVRSWQNPAYADKYKKLSEPVKKEKTRGSKLAGAPRAYVNNPNKVSVWKRPTTDAAFARRKRSFC